MIKIDNFNPIINKNNFLLFNNDCFIFMKELINKSPNGLFDMIFVDPPYFLSNDGITCQSGKMIKVNKGDWDKSNGLEENYSFNLEWLSLCQKLLKPNGTIWVSGTHHNIFSIGFAMQKLKYKILNLIVWEKPNPPPNLSCRYFTHSFELLVWASKNESSQHFFNYEMIKKVNNNKQEKSVWTIPAPSENEKKFGKHPTQKPINLLKKIILASTQENDLIFDPFSGSGTTGIVAVMLNRNFVGCEINPDYINITLNRLNDLTIQPSLF